MTITYNFSTNALTMNSTKPLIIRQKKGLFPADQYKPEDAAVLAIASIPQVIEYIRKEWIVD